MTDLSLFRTYDPHECASTGYPFVWKSVPCPRATDGNGDCGNKSCVWCGGDGSRRKGVKDIVREEAGHRCARCAHPFRVGASSVYEEGDELHPRRTKRDAGVSQAAVDLTLEGFVADGEVAIDPKEARRTNWSPCDELCRHGGDVRARVTPDRPWERLGAATVGQVAAATFQGNEVQAAWRILTVHHLNGRKHDLRWFNLVALCQRDHLYIQRKVHMERVFPYEHSAWFQPYAAGWYAAAYLGENLTREQTTERLEELLALERMA